MAGFSRTIKRRIRSAHNIKQITKAMEMVSASKMRRAQEKAIMTRPYSTRIREILVGLATQIDSRKHPMLRQSRKHGSIGIILIATERGLCGALNSNLFRSLEEFISFISRERPEEALTMEFIIVGRKAREYILKSGKLLFAEFTHFPQRPRFDDVLPIARLAIDGFQTHKFREVYLVYTAFVSTLKQEVASTRLLPLESAEFQRESTLPLQYREYIFEPSPDEALESLLPHYIEMQIFQTILEALASEHSARMVAMHNASDNATEIINDLTLMYNKQRQQAITNEIADLTTSRLALQGR